MKIYNRLANAITFLRLLLAPLVAYTIFVATPATALWVLLFFTVVALTDFFDGLCARYFGVSQWGAFADPLADKVLIQFSMVALWFRDLVPLWIVVLVVTRDLWVTYARALLSLQGKIFKTSMLAKYKTFLQCVGVGVSLGALHGFVPYEVNYVLWISVAILTIISAADYTYRFFMSQLDSYSINRMLLSGFFFGYAPIAPGTAGTVCAWLIFLVLRYMQISLAVVISLATLFFVIGILLLRHNRDLEINDPGWVVIDEIAAFLVVLACLPAQTLVLHVIAFVLFRFFDTIKIGLVRTVDSYMKTALGIMLDDLIAAAYTLGIIWFFYYTSHSLLF